MKKFLVVLAALFFANAAFAANELSVGFSIGLVPDMCGMGATILKDGAVELNDASLASAVGIGDLIWADNEMGMLVNNARGTNAVPLQTLSGQTEGAPMNGLNLELNVMFDMTSRLNLPLFVRLGINYAFAYNGVEQEITLGRGVDQVAFAKGYPLRANGTYAGSSASVAWHAHWWDIPLTIGVILPIADKGKIYGGLGLSWMSGGWGVDVDMDAGYVAMLTSYQGQAAPLVDKNVSTTVDFMQSYITLHFMLGAEVFVAQGIAISFEYWATGAARNTFSADGFDNDTSNVMTAAIYGPTAYGMDNRAMEDFAYPARVGGTFFKLGVKYYIPL